MMTTPEKIRHRQLRLGIIVAFLGVLTVVWGIALTAQNRDQRTCLQRSLSSLSNAFTVRAHLNDQRNLVVTRKNGLLDQEVNAQHDLIKAVSVARTQQDVARAFARFNRSDAALARESVTVSHQLTRLNSQIKSTAVPAFPAGKCS